MSVIIKRYQNRKLYNTQAKRYITLEGIADLIKNDQEIKVIENHTGKDITAVTLSQIIFEIEKNRSGFLPIKILLSLVQSGGNKLEDFRHIIFNSLSLYHHYDVEIERRINLLVDQGELSQEEGTQLFSKLLNASHQLHRPKGEFEGDIYDYLSRRQIPTTHEIQTLIHRIDNLSQNVDKLSMEYKNKGDFTNTSKS